MHTRPAEPGQRATRTSTPDIHRPGRRSVVLLCAALLTLPGLALAKERTPQRLGWVEKALIRPENIAVKVKIDTGAKTSSMHAENVEKFEKDGEPWVRFTVALEDANGERVSERFERKLVREIDVRGAAGAEERVVVRMEICLGNQVYREQFSLNDRDDMIYPVLLGRRTIEDLGVVDVTKTFTIEPDCSEADEEARANGDGNDGDRDDARHRDGDASRRDEGREGGDAGEDAD
jgi:hypothetical protein